MGKFLSLNEIYNAAEVKGVKSEIEDKMVSMYPHNLNPRASSIDTPLHGFIPYKHVDHTHPNATAFIEAHAKGLLPFGGQKYDSLVEAEREAILLEFLPRLRGMVLQKKNFVGTITLRSQLASFYAQHTLLKAPITPEDQAEAAYLLISGQLGKTTGQIISVDGGLHEAFLR